MIDLDAASRELDVLLPGRVRLAEPMKKHTSWHIGGPADIFIELTGKEELRQAVSFACRQGIPLFVIGSGSNLLVCESGIRGIVVKFGSGLGRVTVNNSEIVAEAGAKLAKVAVAARDAGLGGFEFSAGIPGTVGGAVVMNAGANGHSISSLVREVLVLNHVGEFSRKSKQDLNFAYRSSVLQQEPMIVVEASFTCQPREREDIIEEMDMLIAKRKLTQPLYHPNAGSVFKNPPGDSAGRLIEMAGLKGRRYGGAQISDVHANFIVNLGTATAQDVLALINIARSTVREQFGVDLATEVKLIGPDLC